MSFSVLAIRSGLDTEDDTLHPILSDASQPELIALDAFDGRMWRGPWRRPYFAGVLPRLMQAGREFSGTPFQKRSASPFEKG